MTRTLRAAACIAGALALAGCGDDKPVSDPGPPAYQSPAPSPVAALPDPPKPVSDPLLPQSGPISDPLLQSDPLLGTSRPSEAAPENDPLKGRAMPTEHSHWLRGRVQGAKLTVRLNGVHEGDYLGYVDKDITMKLRAGINTVSFEYTPRGASASARMDLLESEHHPPIAPLASFQSSPSAKEDAKPMAEKLTFFAR